MTFVPVDSVLRIELWRERPGGKKKIGHTTGDYKFGTFGLLARAVIRFGRAFGTAGESLPRQYWFGRLLGSRPKAIRDLHNFAHEIGHAYGEATNAVYQYKTILMKRWNDLPQEMKRNVENDARVQRILDMAMKAKRSVENYAEEFALHVVLEADK